MDKICDKEKCTGCGACKNICTKNAIKMEYDDKGFLIPVIDKEKCINCGLCKKICPIENDISKFMPIKIYACKNKNQSKRETSSSGGFFQEISEYILNKNGKVFGAVFDDEFKVIHGKANNINELEKIKKSKYVQSDTKYIYRDLRNELQNEKSVIFSGTPCQVQPIKNMKLKNEENLVLVDLVCHGVPSPKVFEDYKRILENKYKSKISNINFRFKKFDETQNIKINFENGEEYISSFRLGDMFYRLFLKDLILRDSCYNCRFRSFDRISDISLADFWGIENGSAKNFADKKGISLVLINTEKGLRLFEQVKENLEYCEVLREDCENYNSFKSISLSEKNPKIWQDYKENGLEYVVNKNGILL